MRGRGGAITNFLAHALTPSVEVVTILVSAGVLERHPGLRVAAIECGIGWLPWAGATQREMRLGFDPQRRDRQRLHFASAELGKGKRGIGCRGSRHPCRQAKPIEPESKIAG